MNRDLQNLTWLLTAPNLLRPSPSSPKENLVSNEHLLEIKAAIDQSLESETETRARFIAELQQSVGLAKKMGRLGRYMEAITAFAVTKGLDLRKLSSNLAIQGDQRTIGELDLLFESSVPSPPEHWELSVKFYICVADSEIEFRDSRSFLGTFVEDRLDRKLNQLFQSQLKLTSDERAQAKLLSEGWSLPFNDRVLMKGLFFYPSHSDWKQSPLPEEISPSHERGWWTPAEPLKIARTHPESRYVKLHQADWLGVFEREVASEEILQLQDLEEEILLSFAAEPTPTVLRRKEMTVAEVLVQEETAPGRFHVLEISRGHIVHRAWPELARWARVQSLESLEASLKQIRKSRV